MTVEYLVRFCISLFDLGVFWHYMLTFRKRKYVPEPACACTLILLAAVWAQFDVEKNPYFNLMVLVAVLTLVTLFFEGTAVKGCECCDVYRYGNCSGACRDALAVRTSL